MKEAEITAKGDFSQSSSKRHSFAEVFLVSLIINLIWGERQDFEINKPAKAAGTKRRSQVTGQVTGHRPQGTGHRLQGTGHRAQVIGHRKRSKNS